MQCRSLSSLVNSKENERANNIRVSPDANDETQLEIRKADNAHSKGYRKIARAIQSARDAHASFIDDINTISDRISALFAENKSRIQKHRKICRNSGYMRVNSDLSHNRNKYSRHSQIEEPDECNTSLKLKSAKRARRGHASTYDASSKFALQGACGAADSNNQTIPDLFSKGASNF